MTTPLNQNKSKMIALSCVVLNTAFLAHIAKEDMNFFESKTYTDICLAFNRSC